MEEIKYKFHVRIFDFVLNFVQIYVTKSAVFCSKHIFYLFSSRFLYGPLISFHSFYIIAPPPSSIVAYLMTLVLVVGRLINNELERIWKEAVFALSRHYPEICLEGMRKTITSLS
jgi:hypothetical protein